MVARTALPPWAAIRLKVVSMWVAGLFRDALRQCRIARVGRFRAPFAPAGS